MEQQPTQRFSQEDLDLITEHVVSKIETDEAIGSRVAQSVFKCLSSNPDLGATLIDFLEERFPHSVLSRDMIIRGRDEEWVFIDPFDESRVKTSSVDISAGEYFWTTVGQHPGKNLFNPYDSESVRKLWKGPYRALTVIQHLTEGPFRDNLTEDDFNGLEMDDSVIILRPGETILAHTDEFIGGRDKVTTMMKARSSWGRAFLSVCKDAGWGDVGYFNRWTMEIQNNLEYYYTLVAVRQPIAQMVFFRVNPLSSGQYFDEGSYQGETDLAKLKKKWAPERMLPNLKRI